MILCVVIPEPQRWGEILDALDAVSPSVEDAGEGCAFCEMHGIEGGAERWLRCARETLAPFSLRFSLGIGSNRFVARVSAHRGQSCEPGEEAAFVAPMPLSLVVSDAKLQDRLRLLGIRTLGELAALPHGPFVRRFGPEAARWHALARGIDENPLVPRPRHLRVERTLFGEGSVANEEALLFALRALVARVSDDLVLLGKRAAVLTLALECEDGETHALEVRVAHPTARETMLFDLIRARLEGIRLNAPIEGLRLGIERMESGGVPLGLFTGDDPDAEAVELALARLDAAFGPGAAVRARVVDGHRPESRVAYERFEALAPQTQRPVRPATATLQFRTFAPREIDVIAHAGAPRFVGTPALAVREYAGPWRVEEEWWGDSLVRDDYDVMLDDGAIYRIARRDGRWFTLGVYD